MSDYVFITDDQVRSDCEAIGITDWSNRKDSSVEEREADVIRRIIGDEALEIPLPEFKLGLEIELEHGTRFREANVSGNHPIATGRIVLAHLKESSRLLPAACMHGTGNGVDAGTCRRKFRARRTQAQGFSRRS